MGRQNNKEVVGSARLIDPEGNLYIGGSGEANMASNGDQKQPEPGTSGATKSVKSEHGLAEQGSSTRRPRGGHDRGFQEEPSPKVK